MYYQMWVSKALDHMASHRVNTWFDSTSVCGVKTGQWMFNDQTKEQPEKVTCQVPWISAVCSRHPGLETHRQTPDPECCRPHFLLYLEHGLSLTLLSSGVGGRGFFEAKMKKRKSK